ncbi:MAG TPA: hypothetical protein VGN83_20350 [Falsiroseomonas sp.]|jgi:acyl-CoA synthetase (AMP-forming)/AMP-acid ligase II|nr:hypothetical protein [Falsiroseomonas sp.]
MSRNFCAAIASVLCASALVLAPTAAGAQDRADGYGQGSFGRLAGRDLDIGREAFERGYWRGREAERAFNRRAPGSDLAYTRRDRDVPDRDTGMYDADRVPDFWFYPGDLGYFDRGDGPGFRHPRLWSERPLR